MTIILPREIIRYLACFVLLGTAHAASARGRCPNGALIVEEAGRIAAVDWIEYDAESIHSRTILTQSRIIDALISNRLDQTSVSSSVTLSWPNGDAPSEIHKRDLGTGAVYWSDYIPSSLEQVVLRARALNLTSGSVESTSLYRDAHEAVAVRRIDQNDWTLDIHNKQYQVLTDDAGCLLSASLPPYGVTIERRSSFSPGLFPLWPANAPAPGAPYTAREIRIASPKGHILAGTLTLPRHGANVPAVILITGLGPSNRNGGTAPWMPLRDMADALTRAGIAVLRVDDVGVGASTGDHGPTTTFDEADDVSTELAWLRSQAGIDSHRIGLVGYSEGGVIAPMIAARDRSIAAIITIAGPGTSGEQLAREQITAEVMEDASVAADKKSAEVERQLAEPLTPREKSFLAIDSLSFARQVKCPSLILQGGSDRTVPTRSAERIAFAMREGGNADVTVRYIPGIGHSLLPDPRGLMSDVIYLPAFWTSPALLSVMTNWAARQLGARSQD